MRPVTRHALRAALLLCASAAVQGCFAMSDEGLARNVPAPRACARDSQCGAGEVCRLPDGAGAPVSGSPSFDGICVIKNSVGNGEVVLEVRPQAGAAALPTQFGPLRLADGQNREIVLPPPVSASGRVVYQGRTPDEPVTGARVRFTLAGTAPGRALVFDAETSAERPGEFARLLPAGAFAVTVSPPDIGGIHTPLERPLGDGLTEFLAADRFFRLEISRADQLLRLSGSIEVDGPNGRRPAAGVQAWAVQARSALAPRADLQPLAQPAVTAADGTFTLWLPRLPEGTAAWHVNLLVGQAPGGEPFPVFLTDELTVAASTQLAAPVVLRGLDEPRTVTGWVLSTGSKGAPGRGQNPVRDAQVTFRTVDGAGFAFTATARTDWNGAFHARLFPAEYVAIARPPDGASDPVSEEELGLCTPTAPVLVGKGDVTDVELVCEPRRQLTGYVLGPERRPQAGVLVDAVRRKDGALEAELREQVETDGAGVFSLMLTRGTWDLVLRPAPDTKLPFKHVRGQVIADVRQNSIVVELDPPFELFGRLCSGDCSRPVAATLEAYAGDGAGGSVLVGRGLSQEDGSYSIILPGDGR